MPGKRRRISLVSTPSPNKSTHYFFETVRLWGLERFDYALVHYDESSTAWNKYVDHCYSRLVSLATCIKFSSLFLSLPGEPHTKHQLRFGWYKKVISLTAQRQGKWWYVKRFAHPSLLKVSAQNVGIQGSNGGRGSCNMCGPVFLQT